MVFSPDSKSLAITRRNVPSPAAATTVILDIPDGNKLYEIEQNLDGLSFSPNGKWLFWEKPEIKALHTNSFELRSMEPANNELTMIPSPDEKFIITGGKDGSIKIWLWPNLEFLRCLMDIECSGNQSRGSTFNYTDEWGRILTYTMPCGAPLPAGAVCTCNCVPGKMETVCTCDKVCTCNRVCSCLSVGGGCSCDRVCSCLSVGGGYRCTCNKVCVCLAT
jgi:WD40 repeat protein